MQHLLRGSFAAQLVVLVLESRILVSLQQGLFLLQLTLPLCSGLVLLLVDQAARDLGELGILPVEVVEGLLVLGGPVGEVARHEVLLSDFLHRVDPVLFLLLGHSQVQLPVVVLLVQSLAQTLLRFLALVHFLPVLNHRAPLVHVAPGRGRVVPLLI